MTAVLPYLECAGCRTTYPVESLAWRCGCGGVLDVGGFAPRLDRAALQAAVRRHLPSPELRANCQP